MLWLNFQGYEKNSHICKNRGDFACGVCDCKNEFVGRFCECSKNTLDGSKHTEDKSRCYANNGSDTECSGRGKCLCGQCQCSPSREYPDVEVCKIPHCQKNVGSLFVDFHLLLLLFILFFFFIFLDYWRNKT